MEGHYVGGALFAGCLDQAVNAGGQCAIKVVGGVLVAERCLLSRVPEAAHDLLGASSGGDSQGAGDVAEVVEVEVEVEVGKLEGEAGTIPLLLPHAGADGLPLEGRPRRRKPINQGKKPHRLT